MYKPTNIRLKVMYNERSVEKDPTPERSHMFHIQAQTQAIPRSILAKFWETFKRSPLVTKMCNYTKL